MKIILQASIIMPLIIGVTMPRVMADDLTVQVDQKSGRIDITDNNRNVLRYHHQTVELPPQLISKANEKHKKYTCPRSDYIHPLYGLDGQILTSDQNKDHPHHRGIYWAWPEVCYNGEKGDLHALQHVWARPVATVETKTGSDWAEFSARSRWMWEDKTPIVHETATIRAWKTCEYGQYIDFTLKFEALEDGVTLARRGAEAYGGFNTRLAPIKDMKLIHHADPPDSIPLMAWQAASGIWAGSDKPALLAVLEKNTNPCYPGDFIKYEKLPWFQPAFPKAGMRYELKMGKPLTLQYRVWVTHEASDKDLKEQWRIYNEKQ